jgi:hypothetical protein
MKIPKRFSLLGQEYTVEVVLPQDWNRDDCVGIFTPNTRQIHLLFNKYRPALEQAFLHELDHAVLLAMGRDELYKDEAFVDLHAGLHQALSTGK